MSFCQRALFCTLTSLAAASSILAGTDPATVDVRLLTPVSSRITKPGTPVRALVVGGLQGGAPPALAVGSILQGRVTRVRRVGLGLVHETAKIAFDFDQVELPSGETSAIKTRLLYVDNARERVDRKGVVRGTRATDSLSHRMAARAANLALHHPLLCVPLFITQASLVHFPDPEINFPAGTDMTVEVPGVAVEPPVADTVLDSGLEQIVNATPYWSYSVRQNAPMDIVNLLFVGSRDAVERAFTAARWTPSQHLTKTNGYRMIRAVLENRSVAEAPMRTLLLDGAAPDMSWQRTLNTFTKRHHLRVWERPGEWQGEPVWASAATHDIAVKLSLRYGFTHDISNNIDVEREKVINDLRLTGCVDSITRVSRAPELRTAAGDERPELETDGNVAVVKLNDCISPATIEPVTIDPGPGVVTRVVRRLALSARNQYVRNNLPWRMCDLGRMGIVYLRNRYRDYEWRRQVVAARARSTADAN